MTSFKSLLLGGIAATSVITFSAMADNHPHGKKTAPEVKSDIPTPKLKKAMLDAKKVDTKMASKKMSDAEDDTSEDEDKWDVMNPPGDKREIDIQP